MSSTSWSLNVNSMMSKHTTTLTAAFMSRTLSSVTIVATCQRSRGSVTKTFSHNAKSQVEALIQFTFLLNRAVTLQEKHVNKKKTD